MTVTLRRWRIFCHVIYCSVVTQNDIDNFNYKINDNRNVGPQIITSMNAVLTVVRSFWLRKWLHNLFKWRKWAFCTKKINWKPFFFVGLPQSTWLERFFLRNPTNANLQSFLIRMINSLTPQLQTLTCLLLERFNYITARPFPLSVLSSDSQLAFMFSK